MYGVSQKENAAHHCNHESRCLEYGECGNAPRAECSAQQGLQIVVILGEEAQQMWGNHLWQVRQLEPIRLDQAIAQHELVRLAWLVQLRM